MRGSCRVQSARNATTPREPNSRTTASLCSATRLFTWHVTHHAAVKSTNTARPCDVYEATFSGDQSSHASSPGAALALAAEGGEEGPGHATTTPDTARIAATAARHGAAACSHLPNIPAAMAMRTRP